MASHKQPVSAERPMESFRHVDERFEEGEGADPGTTMLALFSLMALALGATVLYGLFSF